MCYCDEMRAPEYVPGQLKVLYVRVPYHTIHNLTNQMPVILVRRDCLVTTTYDHYVRYFFILYSSPSPSATI